jgi:hypothetical protein
MSMSDDQTPELSDVPPPGAPTIFRGVRRALIERGMVSLIEFPLPCGRRADVVAFDDNGAIAIVEVKSGVPDFRTDQKWPEYRDWCDTFYFAVDDAFPVELIPESCGLFIADAFGAALVRESPVVRLAGARRASLIRRAATIGLRRLHRIEDPLYSSRIPTS